MGPLHGSAGLSGGTGVLIIQYNLSGRYCTQPILNPLAAAGSLPSRTDKKNPRTLGSRGFFFIFTEDLYFLCGGPTFHRIVKPSILIYLLFEITIFKIPPKIPPKIFYYPPPFYPKSLRQSGA
jgi:hypothetical protein